MSFISLEESIRSYWGQLTGSFGEKLGATLNAFNFYEDGSPVRDCDGNPAELVTLQEILDAVCVVHQKNTNLPHSLS